jgi:YVTN family beta-propeller protein
LLIEDSVFNQMDRFQQTRAIRESKHADILQIGEARKELPEPTVDGVVDSVLPPDTNGTNLIVGYLKTVKGDEVIYHWEGSKTGMYSDSLKLNDFTAGQPVPFTIKAELIKGNEGGTVKASYELKRAAGGTSYSDTLEFSVGVQYGVPTFTNAPYTIAPAGRLKNVELLLSTSSNNPIPRGKLSLTLPANFTYADGGSGLREFITDDVGRVSVSGVKGTVIPGPYSLSATSGIKTANATVTITGMGPVGSIPVGEGLNGIVVSPDGTRAYVCNEDSETVSVIDTATNRVLTNIPVARFPSGIAVSPDGTRVYVSNSYSKTVAVIDTATDRVLTNIPTESSSTKVVVSPDGTRAYVKNLDAVSVIDTATDQVLTRIPIVDSSYGVALSPDGTRVYVCKYNKSTVSVIDTATDRVVTNIPVGRYPFGVAVSPDGNRAYVTNSGTLTVSVIDTATDQVVTSIPAGSDPMEIAVSPDGTRAYICNAPDNVVSVIDLTTV